MSTVKKHPFAFMTKIVEISPMAALKASWTAPLIMAISVLIEEDGLESMLAVLLIGWFVSLLTATVHSIIVFNILARISRKFLPTDDSASLFGRWWVLHSLSVWMIPAVLLGIFGVDEPVAWTFIFAVALNAGLVLWYMTRSLTRKRDQYQWAMAHQKAQAAEALSSPSLQYEKDAAS